MATRFIGIPFHEIYIFMVLTPGVCLIFTIENSFIDGGINSVALSAPAFGFETGGGSLNGLVLSLLDYKTVGTAF